MNEQRIREMARLVSQATEDEKIPGAVLLIGNGGKTQFHEAWGYAQLVPDRKNMTRDTMFDLASLSKVVGTWPGIMLLIQEERLALTDKLSEMLHHQKMHPSLRNITLEQLLTHTAGLRPGCHPDCFGDTRKERIDGLFMLPAEQEAGREVVYSDLGFVFLGEILADAMGEKQEYVAAEIFNALGMKSACYRPSAGTFCAATEVKNGRTICGTVHDSTCRMLGGVAGHAGVFSTAEDLGAFCAAVLPPSNHPAFHADWMKRAYENRTAHLGGSRGLGWNVYRERPDGNVVGHTGFTGGSIWMNTANGDYVILLSNRVHPSRENTAIESLRKELFRIAFDVES